MLFRVRVSVKESEKHVCPLSIIGLTGVAQSFLGVSSPAMTGPAISHFSVSVIVNCCCL